MQYRVIATKGGKFNAVIANNSFTISRAYTFSTEAEAEAFINAEKQSMADAVASIPSVSDFFNIAK